MGRWLGPEDGRGAGNRNRVFHVKPLKLGGYSLGHDLLSHAFNMAWRRLGATGANPRFAGCGGAERLAASRGVVGGMSRGIAGPNSPDTLASAIPAHARLL